MSRRRRRRKSVWPMVLFLLFIAAVGLAAWYLYPRWRAAQALQKEMAVPCLSYQLEMELDGERMPIEQATMFGTLARLTGIQESALCHLTVTGRIQGDRMQMTIYPEGAADPLIELFLDNDSSVINETMIYNAIRDRVGQENALLAHLMPRQEETRYMTLEQLEQLFGIDMGDIRSVALPLSEGSLTGLTRLSAKEYMVMLAIMSREKQADGYLFSLDKESLCLQASLGEREGASLGLDIEEPAETLSRGGWLLSLMGIEMPKGQIAPLKSLSITLTGAEGTISMPTSFVDQGTMELISQIRTWIQENLGL